jgi:hypothetical protein
MRQPITTSQSLQLANSLISGTPIKKKIEWKSRNCYAFKNGNGKAELSEGNWVTGGASCKKNY